MLNQGLTSHEAEARLDKYGPNDVEEKTAGLVKKIFAPLYSPVALMLLGAAVLSYLDGKIFDFYFILALYLVNYSIQRWQEFKADKAIKVLRDKLSFNVSTLRDGQWIFVNAKNLAPGDHVRLGLGSIIPVDATLTVSQNLSVNEAVLTGESMPKNKKTGDKVYSGSFIATGNFEAEVTATGKRTNFGKTIFSIEPPAQKSLLEKDILNITRFLTSVSLGAVAILTTVFLLKGFYFEDILTLDLSLVIAGVPVALPAVMAIILSVGASRLAKKLVIVRRLSALEDLANVNLLLTDKTGTLTKNEISVANVISYQRALSTNDVIELAACAISTSTPNTIDLAIEKKFQATGKQLNDFKTINFIPYDSDRKRSTALVEKSGDKILLSLGAPQVIQAVCHFRSQATKNKFEKDIELAADNGYRALALAIKQGGGEEKQMQLIGLFFLADPLDETSRETLKFMDKNGISIKILTGDNQIITNRIIQELDIRGQVLSDKQTRQFYAHPDLDTGNINSIAAFAEISPQDKYELVRTFKTHYIVASTGDGINDLPALKTAHVGIAVSGAVSALKSLADIVLLGRGLSVIKDAIIESRKIFVRLYNYSIYRISESFRLIITILILGLIYGYYPLQPLQLILLALLNDIPIISLAVDKVKTSGKPSSINTKERFTISLLFGSVGVFNSLILFFLMTKYLHLPLEIIQTIFFLKLTISGHALIFIAHTRERWYKSLPATQVIFATLTTQIIATILALSGWLMPAKIHFSTALYVWLWALVWMQISELMKPLYSRLLNKNII